MRDRNFTFYEGDTLQVLSTLKSGSINCVVTSPPYWGLRDYDFKGQLGSEETFEEFLEKIVKIFEEVKRVLHRRGTLWINHGDSWNSSRTRGTYGNQSSHGYKPHGVERNTVKSLTPKDLVGQPWQIAFALQKAGWCLRDDIIWSKTNAMPYSGTDRTTKSHEFVFLFSKQQRYFYDWYGMQEPTVDETGSRRKRSVWSIPTEAYKGAHYATFPRKLVAPIVQGGTSDGGCCPRCLTPMERILEKVGVTNHGGYRKRADAPGAEVSETSVFRTGEIDVLKHVGWKSGCKHTDFIPIPCTVLDIFSGTSTSGIVATNMQRDYIGIDMDPGNPKDNRLSAYEMSMNRLLEQGENLLFTNIVYKKFPPDVSSHEECQFHIGETIYKCDTLEEVKT